MERYSEYKDSGVKWLGEIPSHWGLLPFKRMINIKNGADYKKYETNQTGYPVVGSGGIFAYCSKYVYDGEVVLLGRKGTIDKPLYFKGKFWTVDTMFYGIPHDNAICKYLYYQALTIPFKMYATSTAIPSMTQSDLNNNPMCLPPLPEQDAIVRYLDVSTSKLDKAIAMQQKMIDLLNERKQIIIQNAVTKGLDENVEMKDSGVEWIGMIPKHWEVLSFRHVINVLTDYTANGSFGDLAANVKYLDTKDYARLVRLTDLRNGFDEERGVWVSQYSYGYLSKSELHGGELLIANVGAYSGLPWVMPKVNFRATLAPNMFMLKLNDKDVEVKYIYYLLSSSAYFEHLQMVASATAQPKLNKKSPLEEVGLI